MSLRNPCSLRLVFTMVSMLIRSQASFVRGPRGVVAAFPKSHADGLHESPWASRQQASTMSAGTQTSSLPWSRSPPVGVIFDMDGTLVKPCIDFADMRRRIYTVASHDLQRNITAGCVLELMGNLSPEGRRRATQVFDEIETKAIRDMAFMDGMEDLCMFLDSRGIRRALLTRNVERSVAAFHDKMERHPPFSPAVARDSVDMHGNDIPAKPLPHAIEHICRQWNCHVSEVVMVGDSAKDDIVAANRAGCSSVLLQAYEADNNSGNDDDSHPDEQTPTVAVSSLRELHDMLTLSLESEAFAVNTTR